MEARGRTFALSASGQSGGRIVAAGQMM